MTIALAALAAIAAHHPDLAAALIALGLVLLAAPRILRAALPVLIEAAAAWSRRPEPSRRLIALRRATPRQPRHDPRPPVLPGRRRTPPDEADPPDPSPRGGGGPGAWQ